MQFVAGQLNVCGLKRDSLHVDYSGSWPPSWNTHEGRQLVTEQSTFPNRTINNRDMNDIRTFRYYTQVFWWIPTVRRWVSRIQAYFIMAAADRKWFSGAVTGVSETTRPVSDRKQPPKNHVGHTGSRSGKSLPVCYSHTRFCLELTVIALHSQNTSSKYVQRVGIQCHETVYMHNIPSPDYRNDEQK